MTKQRSFKRLVRARMDKTGESYSAARAVLLSAADEPGSTGDGPWLACSDAKIRERSGRGWEEWFDLLDSWGSDELSHKEVARRVATELGIGALVWEAQAVTHTYERAKGLREVGQMVDGYAVSVSKTVKVPVARLYAAFLDPLLRDAWLPQPQLGERATTKERTAHFDVDEGPTRVHVTFVGKGEAKSTVVVQHARLAGPGDREEMRTVWRTGLSALAALLEERGSGQRKR